jgi:queuosine precursor transporter
MAHQTTRRVVVAGSFAGLLASVYFANYLVEHVGIVRIWPWHLYAPAGVYMAGVAFLFRDTVQRLHSVWLALFGIACGATLSLLVSPTLAGASAAAFTASELTGLVVLWLLGRWLLAAVVTAQVAAAAVDSALFLWLAFHSLVFFQGQFVGKLTVLAVAFPLIYGWRRIVVAS